MGGNIQSKVPPAPARSPLSVSLSPRPGTSADLSQREQASPSGHLVMKVGDDERQMEVPACLCCVCLFLPTPSSLLNCPSRWPIATSALTLDAGPKVHTGSSFSSSKCKDRTPVLAIPHSSSAPASLINPWRTQISVPITSQRSSNWRNLEFVDWTEDQVLTVYWLEWWKMSKK